MVPKFTGTKCSPQRREVTGEARRGLRPAREPWGPVYGNEGHTHAVLWAYDRVRPSLCAAT